MGKLLTIVASFVLLIACQSGESRIKQHEDRALQHDTRIKAEALCRRLSEIKDLPVKREEVNDEVYNGLAELKEAAIPCLIEKLTDTTPMKDPRHEPTLSQFFTVGDAAFFTLIRLVDVPFDEVLPGEIMGRWEAEGLYAYFDYVSKDENRRTLQAQWQAWYDKEYKPSNE